MSRGKLWRKLCFFWKKCRWSYCFQKWAKNFILLSKFFRHNCENCFRRVHRIALRFFFWKMRSDTFYNSRILSRPFSAVSRRCFSRVVKNAWYVCKFSRRNTCLKKLINFLNFSDIGRKVFDFVSNVFGQISQNCTLRVYWNTVGKKILKNIWRFFTLFSDIERKNFSLCQVSVSMG